MDQLLALRVFARIADTGTFIKAAESLKLPPSTATKVIQELESHLGVKLLHRTTRKVSVTPEGAAYYDRAIRVIEDVDEMDSFVANERAQPKGRLRIDVPSILANTILIPAMQTFQSRYPDIELSFGVSDRNADMIGDGVDCVIRGNALTTSTLIARRIAEFDYVTCASSAYIEKYGTPTHPKQLEQGHVIYSNSSPLTGKVFPMLFGRGRNQIEVHGQSNIVVNESTAHVTGLLAGLGVGQTFKYIAQPHFKTGALRQLLKNWERPRHPVHIVYPPNRHLNVKVRVFVDWAAEVFAAFDDRIASKE
ncbi:LysR family transcriptional regulator [Burkholderia sp. IMCC1007]|uniref:LysR family transcriptional regulator n=1 Tax=Burkholderia sp. IMCC1007 TaxID=3004104 RepID=UPI0022B50270|nr:LysR family transcriptional regulator [Burkholderia sp. IMCC1007]